MNILESIVIALDAVRAHALRSFLTLVSIAIGIFAIIGSGTAISSLNATVTKQLEAMGDAAYQIKRTPSIQMGNTWRKYRNRKALTYQQAKEFKKLLNIADAVSIGNTTFGITVKNGNLSTNPDVSLHGVDDAYFITNNISLSDGRQFLPEDIAAARPLAVIGNDAAVKLFPRGNPIGQSITIKNQRFTVIGILTSKGSMLGQSQDNEVLIPISNLMKYYVDEWEQSVAITVKSPGKDALEASMDESIGLMRALRNVKPWEDNNFEIETGESLSTQFATFTSYLNFFGLGSGLVALVAAGVGIMNIMLVSVKERTREIGIRKAIGARKSWILMQFLVEAITLCQLGGAFGIGLGLGGGLLLSSLLNAEAAAPVGWIIFSVAACTVLGVAFGLYPAWRAARLDPIEALRYE
ncbi:ABC transporter permease [Ignavibacteria bacterium]|nr:ABC transporter permease [Bacteroidota bacterium]MCZ2131769.1 ABC transporter permease [Bacteroidota bacterium]